jgi:hypothetical protein
MLYACARAKKTRKGKKRDEVLYCELVAVPNELFLLKCN